MADPNARYRVLIVEDEWLIAEALQASFEEAGYEVQGPVARVSEALKLIQQGGIDVAILDVSLNRETSFPIAQVLAERAIPFVFLTGYAGNDLPDSFKGRPVLSKPVRSNELLQFVGALLLRPVDPV